MSKIQVTYKYSKGNILKKIASNLADSSKKVSFIDSSTAKQKSKLLQLAPKDQYSIMSHIWDTNPSLVEKHEKILTEKGIELDMENTLASLLSDPFFNEKEGQKVINYITSNVIDSSIVKNKLDKIKSVDDILYQDSILDYLDAIKPGIVDKHIKILRDKGAAEVDVELIFASLLSSPLFNESQGQKIINNISGLLDKYSDAGDFRRKLIESAKEFKKITKSPENLQIFHPKIKEFSDNTEMFKDFLSQAKEQDVKVNRDSNLYKQIADEVDGAKEFYEDLKLSDTSIADALYLSTLTEQAQKGLRDSKVKELTYHGRGNKPFSNFRTRFVKGNQLVAAEQEFVDKVGVSAEEYIHKNKINISDLLSKSERELIDIYGINPKNIHTHPIGLLKKVISSRLPEEKFIYSSPDKEYAIEMSKFKGGEGKYLPLLLNTKKVEYPRSGIMQGQPSVRENPSIDTYIGKEEAPITGFDIPTQAVRNPTQLKSLYREHLGKWDWNNPNIHKVAGAGIGAGGLAAYLANKEEQSARKGGTLNKVSKKRKGGCIVYKDKYK